MHCRYLNTPERLVSEQKRSTTSWTANHDPYSSGSTRNQRHVSPFSGSYP